MRPNTIFIRLGGCDKKLFRKIKDEKYHFFKPYSGGLWACKYDENNKFRSAWSEFLCMCWEEPPSVIDYDIMRCTIFRLKDSSRILKLKKISDFKSIANRYGIWVKDNYMGIDFHKVKEDYDAIFLTKKGNRLVKDKYSKYTTGFKGWDVPSLLVLRFSIIEEVEEVSIIDGKIIKRDM